MARKKSSSLTDAELRLMDVVWEKGKATVSEVIESLPKDVPPAYSTVTMHRQTCSTFPDFHRRRRASPPL